MTHVRQRLAVLLVALTVPGGGCRRESPHPAGTSTAPATHDGKVARVAQTRPAPRTNVAPARDFRIVHVICCLCDNRHQGIVPVSPALGDGQNPRTNLYWGAMYGTRTFLVRSGRWEVLEPPPADADGPVLDRLLLKRTVDGTVVYLFAEAYDGARMKEALESFCASAAGRLHRTLHLPPREGQPDALPLHGSADLLCFVGHNGLMDGPVTMPTRRDGWRQQAAVLACKSDAYFRRPLEKLGCSARVTTHGLMAPEAYSLEALIDAWARGGDEQAMRKAAADAYARYQRCRRSAAERLFGAR